MAKNTVLLLRYARLVRFAWLNPSCAEAQAAMHAFERAHPKTVEHVTEVTGPLLNETELSWAIDNLAYFATGRRDRWQRVSRTDDEAREMLGKAP